jgi:glycosyltransferase involved in cell wall biosynthesis
MKLSIITINKDNIAGLKKTLSSVVGQTCKKFEWIIIDGASTDGSGDAIKSCESDISFWISEPDTGIYNAINKGIRIATGDYCLFLNSGDYLINTHVINDLFNELAETELADIYYSDMITSDNEYVAYPVNLDLNFLIVNCISHQNSIIRKELFVRHGYYTEKRNLASDREFWIKAMYLYKAKFKHLNTMISVYDRTGDSAVNWKVYVDEDIICLDTIFDPEIAGVLKKYKIFYQTQYETIYYKIITKYGNSKLLEFLLHSYRFVIDKVFRISLFRKIFRKFFYIENDIFKEIK